MMSSSFIYCDTRPGLLSKGSCPTNSKSVLQDLFNNLCGHAHSVKFGLALSSA